MSQHSAHAISRFIDGSLSFELDTQAEVVGDPHSEDYSIITTVRTFATPTRFRDKLQSKSQREFALAEDQRLLIAGSSHEHLHGLWAIPGPPRLDIEKARSDVHNNTTWVVNSRLTVNDLQSELSLKFLISKYFQIGQDLSQVSRSSEGDYVIWTVGPCPPSGGNKSRGLQEVRLRFIGLSAPDQMLSGASTAGEDISSGIRFSGDDDADDLGEEAAAHSIV